MIEIKDQHGCDLPLAAKADGERERRALAAAGIGMVHISADGVVKFVDETAVSLLSGAKATPDLSCEVAAQFLEVGHAGERPWEVVLRDGKARGLTYSVRRLDDKLVTLRFDGYANRDESGQNEAVLLVRPMAQEPATADPYRAIFESVNDGIFVHDIDTGAILDMNRRATEILEYALEDAPPEGPHRTSTHRTSAQQTSTQQTSTQQTSTQQTSTQQTSTQRATKANAEAFGRMLKAAADEPQLFEWGAIDRHGQRRCLEVNLKRARIGQDERLLAVVRDITHRKAVEHALRTSQERYRAIIEASHDIIWALDTKGCFTFVNKRGEEITGHRLLEWLGKSFAPLIHPDDLGKSTDAFVRTMRGESVRYEVRVLDRGNRVRRLRANLEPIYEDGGIIGLVGLATDITVRTRLEDELNKAQKLESLGLLAGGIAHDFNNILTAIVGGVTLAKRSTRRPDLQRETLETAEKACLRARELTQQLLTFSRGGAPVRKPASVAELLQETAQFALRGSNVRCDIELEPNLQLVEMDAGQMNQVVNNLLINAAQAMPHGGTITLKACNYALSVPDARLPTLRPGAYVRFSIHDEGDGIPNEHLPNIFDPYFTTKPAGTGLGLATCYSIVKRHDGYIDVETQQSAGTTFHIYLPATDRSALPTNEPPAHESKRSGRVLLMDDEPMVRKVGTEMLRLLGFDTAMASDGEQAIRLYREALEAGDRFDVVILDLTVPGGMGGRETAVLLRNIDSSAQLIASTGYSTDPVMSDHKSYGFDGAIAKPYAPEDLDRAIDLIFSVKQ